MTKNRMRLAAAILLVSVTTQAQDASTETVLDENVVTSGLREVSIREVATSISVMDVAERPTAGKDIRPAVTLVSAWLTQHAQDIDIDPALLGTRADIEALLRGDNDARLATGWRAEHVGDPIRRLVNGQAALAFEDGRLLLEDR